MRDNFVSNKDVSVRMFRSDFLERFTRVHPAVPHALYVPVMVLMIWLGLGRGASPLATALLFLGGVLTWTLVEYLVHRFVFHVDHETMEATHQVVADTAPGEAVLPRLRNRKQLLYFLAHGVHHDFPSDSRRLVMPPSISIPLAFVFYFLFRVLLGPVTAPSFFAGFVLGYLIYDTTHFAVHHFKVPGTIGRYLKKRHARHHFFDPDSDYGVSSPLWDFVFGTYGHKQPSKATQAH